MRRIPTTILLVYLLLAFRHHTYQTKRCSISRMAQHIRSKTYVQSRLEEHLCSGYTDT